MSSSRYKIRLFKDRLFSAFAVLSALIGLSFLLLILFQVCHEGLQALSFDTFTKTTPPPGEKGGLANAMVGSFLLSGLAMLLSVPLGVMAGVYLAEFGRNGKLAMVVAFLNDILLSAPSICFGLFVYEIIVLPTHGFSGYAGAVALAFIAIPVILQTTRDMLTLVPDPLREAASALGAPRWKVVFTVCFRVAKGGIMTGILLSFARIAGETAPLLFTALNNRFWNVSMAEPMPNLPMTIYQLALSPYPDWHELAWAGAMVITLTVLSINVLTRFLTRDPSVNRI
ncbi:MAG: phosphate ABC transporter permease PstA [Alphaproteobacteria bacterium]|nr:phosphate ABC transporter permease PstA [Alphaproteobacteria bacterium]